MNFIIVYNGRNAFHSPCRYNGPVEGRNLRFWFIPIQVTFDPHIGIADKEYKKEYCHFEETKKAELTVDECPWKENRDFDIENEKDKSCNIKADIEANPSAADRFFTAFVRGIFFRIWAVRTEYPCTYQAEGDKNCTDENKDKNLAKFR